MTDDPRCCGSGTCIIDPEGRCWCGQHWDGQQMRAAPRMDGDAIGGKRPSPGAGLATRADACPSDPLAPGPVTR